MIRLAVDSDIPRIVDMGMRFRGSPEYADKIAGNKAQMEKVAAKVIEVKSLLVSERGEVLTGMIGFFVYDHFVSGEKVAGELFWWVEPEYRGDGIRLLKAAEELAKKYGATSMQMVAPNEQVGRVYKRLGYGYVESSFQRTL